MIKRLGWKGPLWAAQFGVRVCQPEAQRYGSVAGHQRQPGREIEQLHQPRGVLDGPPRRLRQYRPHVGHARTGTGQLGPLALQDVHDCREIQGAVPGRNSECVQYPDVRGPQYIFGKQQLRTDHFASELRADVAIGDSAVLLRTPSSPMDLFEGHPLLTPEPPAAKLAAFVFQHFTPPNSAKHPSRKGHAESGRGPSSARAVPRSYA